jgi:hypothetical protein
MVLGLSGVYRDWMILALRTRNKIGVAAPENRQEIRARDAESPIAAFAKPVQQMHDREDRMLSKHSRAAVSHHVADSIPVLWFVTMGLAVSAHRFVNAVPAVLQTEQRVVGKFRARGAQPAPAVTVMTFAKNGDHRGHGFRFAIEPCFSHRHTTKIMQ